MLQQCCHYDFVAIFSDSFFKKATSNKSSDFFFLVLLETFVDSNVKAYIILTLLSRQLVLPWAPLPSLTLTPAAVGAEDVQPLYP